MLSYRSTINTHALRSECVLCKLQTAAIADAPAAALKSFPTDISQSKPMLENLGLLLYLVQQQQRPVFVFVIVDCSYE